MDGWSAYEKLVLDKLDSVQHDIRELQEGLILVRIDVAKLKVKAGVWGAAAGMVPAILTVGVSLLSGGGM